MSTNNGNEHRKNITNFQEDKETLRDRAGNSFSNILGKFFQQQAMIFDKFSNILATKQTEDMNKISTVIGKQLNSINDKSFFKEENLKASKT